MQREQPVQRDPGLRVTNTLREHQCGESREGWRGNQTDKGSGSVPRRGEPYPDGPEESHEGYTGVEAGTDMGIP